MVLMSWFYILHCGAGEDTALLAAAILHGRQGTQQLVGGSDAGKSEEETKEEEIWTCKSNHEDISSYLAQDNPAWFKESYYQRVPHPITNCAGCKKRFGTEIKVCSSASVHCCEHAIQSYLPCVHAFCNGCWYNLPWVVSAASTGRGRRGAQKRKRGDDDGVSQFTRI